MTTQNDGYVKGTICEGIGTISFFHPQSNSLPGKILRGLAEQIERYGQDPNVRVIVLKSDGDGPFCAGASFVELLNVKSVDDGKAFFSGFALVIMAIKNAPKFVVARVHGKAAGGGVGLVSAADYAMATDNAAIRLSELALGIGPFTIGPAVLRKLGTATFNELSVSADWRDANWAKSRGLYAEVYKSVSELDSGINQFAKKLSGYSPEAMARLKTVLWEGTDDWSNVLKARVQITSELVLSDEAQGAIAQAKNAAKPK